MPCPQRTRGTPTHGSSSQALDIFVSPFSVASVMRRPGHKRRRTAVRRPCKATSRFACRCRTGAEPVPGGSRRVCRQGAGAAGRDGRHRRLLRQPRAAAAARGGLSRSRAAPANRRRAVHSNRLAGHAPEGIWRRPHTAVHRRRRQSEASEGSRAQCRASLCRRCYILYTAGLRPCNSQLGLARPVS